MNEWMMMDECEWINERVNFNQWINAKWINADEWMNVKEWMSMTD